MNLLKFAALLLGESSHYKVIAKSDLDSRRTIIQRAGLMSISIVLAIITGACFAHELFSAGITGMFLSGIILGWFVMMIDRSILSSLETDPVILNKIKNRRIALSILLGLLSSLGVDMWLYHNDVQGALSKKAHEMAHSEEIYFDNSKVLNTLIDTKRLEKERLEMEAEEEKQRELRREENRRRAKEKYEQRIKDEDAKEEAWWLENSSGRMAFLGF